jgi:HEAT repeat protein
VAPDTSFLLACASLGLLAGLVVLVIGKRLVRGLAERRSRRRRERWLTALGPGPVAAMRMRELRVLARGAARGRAHQDDLLVLVSTGCLPPDDDRRDRFERALRRAGLQRALRRAVDSRSAVARGRAALLWAGLGLAGAEAKIAALTSDPDADVRAAATQALAVCGSEEAAWALLRALRDGHVEPQRVVERLTGDWAAGALLSAVHTPAFASVVQWLAEALGLAGDPRAERPLIRLLAGGGEPERVRACRALGRLGRHSSAAALVRALSDPSAAVRAQAARALSDVGDERSVYALAQLLSDSSWWVRARAAEALRALGDPGVAALRWCAETHADPYARERAVEALALEAGTPRLAAATEAAVA